MTFDPTIVTVDELIAIKVLLRDYMGDLTVQIQEDRHRYDRGEKTSGSQLKLLTVAHGCPSTHRQARRNARRLADAVVGEGVFVQTSTPRLHYARSNGGIRTDFSLVHRGGNYHPGRFGIRINLGRTWSCACAIHDFDYDSCDIRCFVGVQLNGRFLIDIVRES